MLLHLSTCADPFANKFFKTTACNGSPPPVGSGVRDSLQTNLAGGIRADVVTEENYATRRNLSAAARRSKGRYGAAEAQACDEPVLRDPLPTDWLRSDPTTMREFHCQLSAHMRWRAQRWRAGRP